MGLRGFAGCQVYVWDIAQPSRPIPLDPARELWNHTPDGFEWGYAGSGPAQLALALLYEITHDIDFAIGMHQAVKFRMIAALARNIWAKTEVDILECALAVAITVEARELAAAHLGAAKARCAKQEVATDGNR